MSLELTEGLEVADRFTLLRSIGEGGMGTVWAADDKESGEAVALKFIKGASTSKSMRRRFLREARAAGAIDHEAIVQVQEILELDDGAPVLVMELLEGESLAARLERDKTIGLEELASIMQPVVSAVGTAHALGIVHRDLKPENIFLAKGDEGAADVRVLDFGIAKLTAIEGVAAQSASLTGTGTLVGTPYYMAPEQVFGEKDLDHRVDVWALGLILYECLAGVLPTEADNVGQVFKIVLTRGIPPLEEAKPEIPQEVADLVNRMVSRRRDERPRDLREVQRVLERYSDAAPASFGAAVAPPEEEPPSSDVIVPIDEAAIDPLGATTPAITARAAPTAPASSRTKLLGIVAVLVVAAAAVWTVSQGDSDGTIAPETGAGAGGASAVVATATAAAEVGGGDTRPAASTAETPEPPSSALAAAPPDEPAPKPTTRVATRPVAKSQPPPKPAATVEPQPTAAPEPTASQPKGPRIQQW
ncbi:MAG: protein kinase [Deltaproteobacteria bacterium]|jgi:serine/threonine-protein kinase|nr:protein kinase [Deltaproteobacteria bacterium]MBW2530410.1 protein kinase [Deltaproteobacteria bacterium]